MTGTAPKRKKHYDPARRHPIGRLLRRLPPDCRLLPSFYRAAHPVPDRRTIAMPDWPAGLDGLRVAFATDFHCDEFFDRAHLNAVIADINAYRPDIVLLGGDYAQDFDGSLALWRTGLGIKCPFVCAVPGNHDTAGAEGREALLYEAMLRDGCTPLVNRAVFYERAGARVAIAGTGDLYAGQADIPALRAQCAGADCALLLTHSPDLLPEVCAGEERPFFSLALCGHTHGGQVLLLGHPLKTSSDYGARYLSGLYREHGAAVFVSAGVGTTFLPLRFGTRGNYHLLTLIRAETGGQGPSAAPGP